MKWTVFALLVLVAGCKKGAGAGEGEKASTAPAWSTRDLGPGRCLAINSQGEVLGIDDSNTSFLVDKDGKRTMLPSKENGTITIGLALSESGEVIGYKDGSNGRRAVRYRNGAWSEITELGDVGYSSALGYSENGDIVGTRVGGSTAGDASSADGGAMNNTSTVGIGNALQHGYVLASGALQSLPLPADKNSAVYLSLAGRIAGVYETADQKTHAFVVNAGQLQDLGSLGGESSAPYALDTHGDVVGAAEVASGSGHAFYTANGGQMVDITPAGSDAADARGIDDQGRIAINALDAKGLSHPALYVAGKTGTTDLSPLDAAKRPYVGAHVAAMLADGRIVGWGVPPEDNSDAGAPPNNNGAAPSAVHCLVWSPPESGAAQ